MQSCDSKSSEPLLPHSVCRHLLLLHRGIPAPGPECASFSHLKWLLSQVQSVFRSGLVCEGRATFIHAGKRS